MSANIEIVGIDATIALLTKSLEQLTEQVDADIQGAGIEDEAEAKKLAAVDTGRFRAGYHYEKTGICECQVSNPVEYGPPLEFGTIHMAAQPSAFPAFEIARRHLLEAYGL